MTMTVSDEDLRDASTVLKYSVLTLSLFYWFVIQPLFVSRMSRVPGPTLCKLSWSYLAYYDVRLMRNIKIHEWHQTYGPIVCIRPREVSFASPSLMREIYGASGKYDKSQFFDQFVAFGERAVFSVRTARVHRQKRMAVASFFHKASIDKGEMFVRRHVHALFEQIDIALSKTPSQDIFSWVSYYAFDNITRLLYGHRHCSSTIEGDHPARHILTNLRQAQLWGPFTFNYPRLSATFSKLQSVIGIHKGFMVGEHQLKEWTYQRYATAAADSNHTNTTTFLGKITSTKDVDGASMSANYIAAELLDNTNAAQETVTVALTYVLYHLSRNLEWQMELRKELLALPAQADGYPSFADVDEAPLLGAFVREVYRLNPGASGRAERVVPRGGKVFAGIYLPPGIRVSASTIALHRNPSVFWSPDTFDPQRWLQQTPEQLRAMEASFIPFGYGARICLGKHFATMQIKLLVASFCIKYMIHVDVESRTSEQTMEQAGTQDAYPRGLRCDVLLTQYEKT